MTYAHIVDVPVPIEGYDAVHGAMIDRVTRDALSRSQVIDLTNTGRRTGQPRRIEILPAPRRGPAVHHRAAPGRPDE